MITENGWPSCSADGCEWITVPGTTVRLQLQKGQPAAIMRAYAADYNAFVEPLRDPDSAGYTPTNSVATSNHLGGTAMDLNWNSHPFRVADAGYTPQMIATMRELLDFYEGTVFWGNRWDDPKDAMHHQMGYGTYGDPHTADFIARKIRADGYSTFRRGNTTAPSTDAAAVLAQSTGLTITRATAILDQVRDGLATSDCTNANRIAMWLAQIGHESDDFNATQEYDNGGNHGDPAETTDRWKYKGRTWIQITWAENYLSFGRYTYDHNLTPTRTYFIDNPRELALQKWAALGPAWYWTEARPTINSLCDVGDLVAVTKLINGGTNGLEDTNGRPGRRTRYQRALALGDQLLVLVGDTTTVPTEPEVSMELHTSRSIYRTSNLRTMRGDDASLGADACGHMNWVENNAIRGLRWALELVRATARGESAGATKWWEVDAGNPNPGIDPWAVEHATGILAYIEATNPSVLQQFLNQKGA